jgi:hypothetical protein
MATLAEIVKDYVFAYAGGANRTGGGFGLEIFPFANDELQAYAVNIIDTPIRKQPAGIVVLAHIADDNVIIDEDNTDRPLINALVRAGVPRENIILVYAGEPVPQP